MKIRNAILLLLFAPEFAFGGITRVKFEDIEMRMKSCGNKKLCPHGRKNVQASTTEKIKKLFNALTMKEKDITIEDLAKRIVISGITTYGVDEIIENIKQFDDGDNVVDFEEFQGLVIFDEDEEFVTDNDIQDFLNKFDGSKDGLTSNA